MASVGIRSLNVGGQPDGCVGDAADNSRAARIIEAYARATTVDQRGAVMLGDEMIDEASRKMAQAIVGPRRRRRIRPRTRSSRRMNSRACR